MSLESDKVVILTGASRGIGSAVAHYLLKKGVRMAVISRSLEPLQKLSQTYPNQVEVLAGDLSDFTLGEKASKTALSRWSRIDALIINHGILDPVKKIGDTTAEEWKASFDVNVFSAIALIKGALPALRSSKGRIIITSSGAAVSSYTAWGAYGAAKAALNHLAGTLAAEEPDVTTVAIRPGTVDTEMQRELREIHHKTMAEKDARKFADLKTTGTLLKPEQPGHVIARVALAAPKELSGRFINWSEIEGFQED